MDPNPNPNPNNTHPGINYPLIKTHKADNPAWVITSGCGTPTENLPLFVEKYCKIALDSISCRIRDTTHMLDIVDELNLTGLLEEDFLVLILLICSRLQTIRQE